MRDNFKVIDADRHVLEPSDLFEKYLPAKFRAAGEILEGPNQSRRAIDGEPISDADRGCGRRSSRKITALPSAHRSAGARLSPKRWRRNSTPRRTLRDMDREGVDVERVVSDSWASTSCGVTISIRN